MKKWTVLAAVLMMAAVLMAVPASADWEAPESPETFEDIPDEQLLREVISWWNDAYRNMKGDSLDTISDIPVLFESARLCMKEVRNRYEAGRIDASILERLLDPVFDQAFRIGEKGQDILEQLYSDGEIDAGIFLSEREKVIRLEQELAENLITELELSLQEGIMDIMESADRGTEVLDYAMEDWRETYDIADELLMDGEIPTGLFLLEGREASDGAFRILDLQTEIISACFDAGGMEEDEYLGALKELIEARTEWIEALAGTARRLLKENALTKDEEYAASEYLLANTSVLVRDFTFWIDAMHDTGRIDDFSYGILKIWMEELGGMIGQIFEEASEGQLATA